MSLSAIKSFDRASRIKNDSAVAGVTVKHALETLLAGAGLNGEQVDDRVAGLLVAGANVTLTYNDPANTLTIAAAGGGGGTGDVVGPASSTNDAVAVYDNTTGKLLRNSQVLIHEASNDKLEFLASFGAFATATDGATVTFDFDLADQWQVTLGGNRTLAFSNASVGQRVLLLLKQDATGVRTVTWWSNITWDNVLAPVLDPTASGWDLIVLECVGLDGYSVPLWKEVSRTSSAPRKGITTVADAATVTFDWRKSPKQQVTLGGNRTLEITAGSFHVGQMVALKLIQDGTGSRIPTYGTSWGTINWTATGGTEPTQPTAAGSYSWLCFVCTTAGGSPVWECVGASGVIAAALVSDAAYGGGWNGVTTVAPSKNAVYDEMELRQPLDATLTALAALTIAADSLTIGTGADAFSQTTFAANTFPAKASVGGLVAKTITDAALTVLDDATVALMVDTLGGAAATGSGGLVRATTPTFVTSIIDPLLVGSTASGGTLTLQSTNHATKGNILFGTSAYDEVNNRLGLGTPTPLTKFDFGTSVPNVGQIISIYTSGTRRSGIGMSSTDTGLRLYGSSADDVAVNLGTLSNSDGVTFASKVAVLASGNVGVGVTAFGTSAAGGVVGLTNGATAPTTSPADMSQLWCADSAAAKANIHARNEDGRVERLTGLGADCGTQFDKTSSVTLSNATGLSHDVEAGRKYGFQAVLFTTSNTAGGIKAAVNGSCTATSIRYEGHAISGNTIVGQTRATVLGTAVCDVIGVTAATIHISGEIVVSAAGTLDIQFAQSVSNAAASSVLTLSTFKLFTIG